MNEKLRQLVDTADMYGEFLQRDLAMSISDREKYLKIINTENMKFPFEEGASIKVAGFDYVLNKIEQTGQPVVNIVPREVTGSVTIKSVISPIYDGRELVGYFSLSLNIEKEERLKKLSSSINESIDNTNKSIEDIVSSSDILNERMKNIEKSIMSAEESLKASNSAIDLIKRIATQSNLLGLNTAIEASRASTGTSGGNGFTVVASEMRKLAGQSKETAQLIENFLEEIKGSIENVLTSIKDASKISENQYVKVEEISQKFDSVANESKELLKYAES